MYEKNYLVAYTILFFILIGCGSTTDETIFVKGNEFYTGSTKEKLEENIKMNKPSKQMVASDSHFITSSVLEMGEKDKSVVNELLQARDYLQKKAYKGHPKYDIIERTPNGDRTDTVISVNHGEYYYLISLNLLSDKKVNIDNEASLASAATYDYLSVNNTSGDGSTDYYFEVLRKIVVED